MCVWLARRLGATGLLLACLLVSSFANAQSQEGLSAGEGFLTRFSGTTLEGGLPVLDPNGTVGSLFDLRAPGAPPKGARVDAPETLKVTASQVGQVFGVTIGGGDAPNIYLAATSAFGLHRSGDNSDWMPGMWGANGGGPGTVYVLDAAHGFAPAILADVVLDGRTNSGPGLGDIAYDAWHDQLFVSDLETGMIHRLRAKDGFDLGHYDHGLTARPEFTDAQTGKEDAALPEIAFDPTSTAHVTNCVEGDFARTPSCWNFADFRRRVFGLGVMHDPATNDVRLYYSVWSSQGFGSPDFAGAGDDQRNAIWSVGITPAGDFDTTDIRREFLLPDFFSAPEAIARAGHSDPVTGIAFSVAGGKPVMLLAERGGVRNLGFGADAPFAYPHESRVLRYERGDGGKWQPAGRYDVGESDRKADGVPFVRANAAGGVAFGPGFDASGKVDPTSVDGSVWMTGDGLCSAAGPCVAQGSADHSDASDVDGLQVMPADKVGEIAPEAASKPYPASGSATPAAGPDASYMIDADGDTSKSGATMIGDIAVYQPLSSDEAAEALAANAIGNSQPPGADEAAGNAPPYYSPDNPPFDPGYDPLPPPPDGDWPNPPPELLSGDLGIVKTGPASCQKGVDCLYTLKITNNGPIPYNGPLAINDTMPAGATLSTGSPGWHCTVAAPVVSCVTTSFATLGVGVSATLELVIRLPAMIATPTVQNCGAIDWFEMGTDDGPGDSNDISCIDTPVTDGFDLGIEKTSMTPTCVAGAQCVFLIKVTNFGPGTFSGNLVVHDTLPPNTSFAGGGECSSNGTGVDCENDGLTLAPTASKFFVVFLKPAIILVGQTIENCVDIDWSHMGADDGTPDLHPDHACVSVKIMPFAGFADLTITKAGPSHCDAGGNCTYTVSVTNNGPDDFNGNLKFKDKPPLGATFVGSGASPFVCSQPVTNIKCFVPSPPTLLPAGQTFSVDITIKLPNPILPAGATKVTNCAHVAAGIDNPAPPINAPNSTCLDTPIGAGFDLVVAKSGPAECYEGKVCDYTLSVTNNGPADFVGMPAVKDALPAGSTVDSTSGAVACAKLGPNETCAVGSLVMPAGKTLEFHVRAKLPDPVATDTVKNCATIDWSNPFPIFGAPIYKGDDKPANDGPFCIDTPVLAADLAPFGGTVCEKGVPCTLNVSIDNRGGRLFKGAAGLRGMLDPAIAIDSVKSMTEGLTCKVAGQGAYECDAAQLMLQPGTSAALQVVITVPADFTGRRIIHRKEMLWPDAAVRDSVPQDDKHVSTIIIKQPAAPKAPACTGGTFTGGKCVCPGDQIARSSGGGNFVCTPPPLACIDGIVRGGQCVCPENTKREQTGANAFRCVTPEAPPPPNRIVCDGGIVRAGECICSGKDRQVQTGDGSFRCITPAPQPPPLVCDGGRIRGGQCDCPDDDKRVQVNDNAYRCIAPPPPPPLTCDGGRVRGGDCACRDGEKRVPTGDRAYKCVAPPPPPPLVCEGGRVRQNRCLCPPENDRVQTGENAYRCVAPERPEITCDGGVVRGGRCLCPRNTDRVQTGDHAFRCTAPDRPQIICEGGRVRDNRCFCPRGTDRQQTGEDAYRCAASETPEPQPEGIICEGGNVIRNRCFCPRGTEVHQTGRNAFQCSAASNGGESGGAGASGPILRRHLPLRRLETTPLR